MAPFPIILTLALATVLTACGGTDDDDDDETPSAGGTSAVGTTAMTGTGATNAGTTGASGSPSTGGATTGTGGGAGGPTCTTPCGAGEHGCSDQSHCEEFLVCRQATCVPIDCLGNPQILGCGFDGAPCGACAVRPTCTTDSECPSGMVCPPSNGWRYGLVGLSVCEPEGGCTGPCGSINSECGLCVCVPQCSDKICGDADLDDGCGERCQNLCADGQGCELDIDCQPGSQCSMSVCTPID